MFLFRVPLSTRLVVALAGLLLASSNIGLASKHDSSGIQRFDILQGTRGESACTLADVIDRECKSSTRRDFLLPPFQNDTALVPSICTCNTIFFNIWSACDYSTGNNTLPIFTHWIQNCTTNSINVDSSIQFSKVHGNLGIDVPPWARIRVPGNSTFDIQRAVTIASSKSRWSTLQVMLPVVASLATILISGVILLIYLRYRHKLSRRTSRMEWPKGLKRLHLHTSHKVVTTIDRDEAWEIDGPSFDDVHNQPPVPLRRVSSNNMETMDVHKLDKKSRTVSNLTTEKAQMRSQNFRMPWKRQPPYITLVPATSRFRVDDVKSVFTCSGEGVGRNEVNVAREVAEDVDHVEPNIGETRSLTSASELAERDSQDVILISKDGRNFTLESVSQKTVSVNSHIKIVSPSVSSTSPHSAMFPASAKSNLHIPIPPRSHAAPASPVTPQFLRPTTEHPSERNRERQSLPNLQSPPFLSPITEASTPMQSSTNDINNHLRRSAAIRPSSNPQSFPSLYISPAAESSNTVTNPESYSSLYISPAAESSNTVKTTPSPSSYYKNLHHHQTAVSYAGPDLSTKAFGIQHDNEEEDDEDDEDGFYMENTTNEQQYHGLRDSDTSFASFYYSFPPVQTPVQKPQQHPVKLISTLHSTGPAAFYAGPVRGAGHYSIRTDNTTTTTTQY